MEASCRPRRCRLFLRWDYPPCNTTHWTHKSPTPWIPRFPFQLPIWSPCIHVQRYAGGVDCQAEDILDPALLERCGEFEGIGSVYARVCGGGLRQALKSNGRVKASRQLTTDPLINHVMYLYNCHITWLHTTPGYRRSKTLRRDEWLRGATHTWTN